MGFGSYDICVLRRIRETLVCYMSESKRLDLDSELFLELSLVMEYLDRAISLLQKSDSVDLD